MAFPSMVLGSFNLTGYDGKLDPASREVLLRYIGRKLG